MLVPAVQQCEGALRIIYPLPREPPTPTRPLEVTTELQAGPRVLQHTPTCCCSLTRSCLTLRPRGRSAPASLSFAVSGSLRRLVPVESVTRPNPTSCQWPRVSASASLGPPHPLPRGVPECVLCSCPENRFIGTIFLDSIYMC